MAAVNVSSYDEAAGVGLASWAGQVSFPRATNAVCMSLAVRESAHSGLQVAKKGSLCKLQLFLAHLAEVGAVLTTHDN